MNENRTYYFVADDVEELHKSRECLTDALGMLLGLDLPEGSLTDQIYETMFTSNADGIGQHGFFSFFLLFFQKQTNKQQTQLMKKNCF